jgi:hypothetical protein
LVLTKALIQEYIVTKFLMKEAIFKSIKEFIQVKSLILANFVKKCSQQLAIEMIMREDILKINLIFVNLLIIVDRNIIENTSLLNIFKVNINH